MTNIAPVIETQEHRWMRAWISSDPRTLKSLTSRNFRLVLGSKPCVILDAPSFLGSAGERFRCSSYRFGDIYVREHGQMAVFATQLEITARLDGVDWSGPMWLTDLWSKGRLRRSWRLVERSLSRLEEAPDVSAAIRSLQLWR